VRSRISLVCIAVSALLAAVSGMATAAPSFYGYTGLLVTPTADALNEGEYNVAGFALDVEEGADSHVYAANMGLAESLEVGFARLKPEGRSGETWINAKYRFLPETETHPAIAAGVFDLTDEVETSTYIVMSKSIAWRGSTELGEITAPRVHIGIAGGQIDGLFAGISLGLGDRFLVMGEYDSENINFGARLAISKEIRIHAGFLEGGDDFGLGLSFNKFL